MTHRHADGSEEMHPRQERRERDEGLHCGIDLRQKPFTYGGASPRKDEGLDSLTAAENITAPAKSSYTAKGTPMTISPAVKDVIAKYFPDSPERGFHEGFVEEIIEAHESGQAALNTRAKCKPADESEDTYINEMIEKHADRADMFQPETEVIETRWVKLMRSQCKPDGDVVAKIKAFKADPTVHDAVHNPADPYSVAWHKREEEHQKAIAALHAQKEVPAEEAVRIIATAMLACTTANEEEWPEIMALAALKALSAAGMRVCKCVPTIINH
jgi:hypothetical protein